MRKKPNLRTTRSGRWGWGDEEEAKNLNKEIGEIKSN
jgi:hypothetical protein